MAMSETSSSAQSAPGFDEVRFTHPRPGPTGRIKVERHIPPGFGRLRKGPHPCSAARNLNLHRLGGPFGSFDAGAQSMSSRANAVLAFTMAAPLVYLYLVFLSWLISNRVLSGASYVEVAILVTQLIRLVLVVSVRRLRMASVGQIWDIFALEVFSLPILHRALLLARRPLHAHAVRHRHRRVAVNFALRDPCLRGLQTGIQHAERPKAHVRGPSGGSPLRPIRFHYLRNQLAARTSRAHGSFLPSPLDIAANCVPSTSLRRSSSPAYRYTSRS